MHWWAVTKLVLYSTLFFGLAAGLFQLLRRFTAIRRVVISYHLLALLAAVFLFITLAKTTPGTPDVTDQVENAVVGMVIFFAVLVVLRLGDILLLGNFLGDRLGIRISVIARHLLVVIILAGVVILVLSKFFGVEVTPLLATSAIGTAIIGLALQDVLGNVIAGVALQAERPFKVGDWVLIGDVMGCVVEMNWRATKVHTLDWDSVTIPNSTVARDRIRNFHEPTRAEARHLQVGVEYGAPPEKVKAVLMEASLGAKGVLHDPAPRIRLVNYGDFAITYDIKFWLERFADHDDIQDSVMTRIWYLFKRHGIQIPFPIRNVYIDRGTQKFMVDTMTPGSPEVTKILRDVSILQPLSDDEVATLSAELRVVLFTRAETLVKQNDPGDSFMIIAEGQVAVQVAGTEVARLGEHDHFGEMSLLTGEPRNATVVALTDTRALIIDRPCFERVLKPNPAVAEQLSKELERINAENIEKLKAKGVASTQTKPTSAHLILRRVRKFFGLD